MKKFLAIAVTVSMMFSAPAKADLFGGDVAVLIQILANALKQLVELQNLVKNGSDQLDLMRNINRGVNDSLQLAKTIYPDIDPGLYKDWQNVSEAIQKLETIYGIVTNSPDARIYRDTDQQVAEAVTLNNDIYKYTQGIDELGEVIKNYSHDVSPGGAQKLTAQTLGVMLQVMNQSLRTQATGLKLQAQTMAIQNKRDKDSTKQYLETANTLRVAMKNEKVQFTAPRF
ncbi:MAG: hypothetical protein ACK5V3_12500 [Bdellovibrionales bacterium]